MISLDKLTAAIEALKTLCAQQRRYEAMRDKSGNMDRMNSSMKRIGMAHTNMNFQAVHVRRCHKAAWKAIVAADLKTTLEPEEAYPTGWHKYKI